MKKIFFLFLTTSILFGQKKPEDFGYKTLTFEYQKENVAVIIQSKKGEELIAKPLFFWCQGSLPQPVIKYNDKGALYGTFPFNVDDFLDTFHIVIVGKPDIPIISNVSELKENFCFLNENNQVTKSYSDKNYLDYYVKRNNFILQKLRNEKWVSKTILVVAGHSEGSTVAATMALKNKKITHLIYSSGNPYGRILSILEESIYYNQNYDTVDYWKIVVNNKDNLNFTGGDTYKCTYSFSQPSAKALQKIKIPILITYGSKDWSAPFNNMFYLETITNKLKNITVIPYSNLDHNFFPVNEKLEPNYEIYNWENVGKDWINWITKN
ncbi:hypothetical protein [Flavobacterium sp.]